MTTKIPITRPILLTRLRRAVLAPTRRDMRDILVRLMSDIASEPPSTVRSPGPVLPDGTLDIDVEWDGPDSAPAVDSESCLGREYGVEA